MARMTWDDLTGYVDPNTNAGTFWRQGQWDYSPGREKPWWMSEQRWAAEQAKYQMGQWQKNASAWMASLQQGYSSQLQALTNFASTHMPTFNPIQWSDYQGRYGGYQNSLDSLLARIQGGPTTEDETAAFEQMARLYGMTPEQFRTMQSAAYNTTAEDINKRAETMAFDPNSEANKTFEAMIRSQQRAAEAGMGKQLETIFADRGGLGGFAAAQDFTLQISDQMLKQRSQFMLDRMAQSVQLINQDLDRKYALLQSGQQDAKDFLNQRWANLQTAYQDTMAQANQVLQEYATRSGVNQADFQANLAAFSAQFGAMKDILLTQVGIDASVMQQMSDWYDLNIKPFLDQIAISLGGV